MPAAPVARPPDVDFATPVLNAEQAGGGRRAPRGGGGRPLFGDAPRRHHRLGQDRGLFRGGRRGAPARPAGADPHPGDRAHHRLPRALRRAASARGRASGTPRSRRGMRERVWRGVADGSVRVVVGARSALFLPFAELGLIVVDEEHDLAYKQEDRVFYNARDMAVVRGHLAGFPVVLVLGDAVDRDRGSMPTPAATRGIVLADRYAEAKLPEIAAIDMRRHPPERGRYLSPPLVAAVAETLARGPAGAPLPQPPRLCAAHPLPHLRPPLPVPQLLDLAGRAPLPRRAPLPPLRPLGEAAGRTARTAATPRAWSPVGPGVERLGEEVAARFPERAHHPHVERHDRRRAAAAARNSPRSRRARSTSSSAPSSSPRATISRT